MDHPHSPPLFTNVPVDLSTLPRLEEVEWTPLQKKYLPVSLAGAWLFALLLCGIFVFVNLLNRGLVKENWIHLAVLGGIVFLFSLISLFTWVGFKYKGYALREHDVLYKSGWIFRRVMAVPFNRVQHSEIKQGPLERQYNLASLEVYTAGGQGSDLTIPGLRYADAQSLKSYIMEKTAASEG